MTFLKSIGLWILKLLLGGLFNKIESAEVKKAEQERDAAELKAESVEVGKELEKKMIESDVAVEKKAAEEKAARPPSDPFGVDDWNKK
jgi:DNA-binding protein H-NS